MNKSNDKQKAWFARTTVKVAMTLIITVMVAAPSAHALTMSDINLLITLGIIPAEKADAARALATTSTPIGAHCGPFTRNLTIGSTGADVVALQSFLVARGALTMPVGVSMGYFGTLTRAALAQYQASVGIAPPAGYFGPITRAHIHATCVPVTPTPPPTTTPPSDELRGGEASLRSYSVTSKYSNEDVHEGETRKVLAAEFDVRDGDVRIERVDIRVEAVNPNNNENSPWRHIDQVALYMNGERVARMDADSQSDWSRQSSTEAPSSSRAYELRFSGLSEIFREGDTVEIELEITGRDVVSNKPQDWKIWIPQDGIRAIDGRGINQYAGSNSASRTFEILSAREGSLQIRENANDPNPAILIVDQNNRSNEFEVFRFDIRNRDADTFLNTMNIVASTSAGNINNVVSEVRVNVGGTNYRYDSASTSANVGEYLFDFEDGRNQIALDENETVTVRVMARFNKLSGNYTEGTMVQFGIGRIAGNNYGSGFLTAESQSMGDPSTVSGQIEGSIHTLRAEGIAISALNTQTSYRNTNPGSASNIQYGVFEFEVQVTALEDDAFLPNIVGTSSTAGAGFVVEITDAGVPFTGTTTAFISFETAPGSPGTTNNRHRIAEGTSARFTVRVELDPTGASSGQAYGVRLDTIRFSSTSTGSLVNFTVPVTGDFETGRITID